MPWNHCNPAARRYSNTLIDSGCFQPDISSANYLAIWLSGLICYLTTSLLQVDSGSRVQSPDITVKSVTYRNIKAIDIDSFRSDLADICHDLLSIDDIKMLASE